MSIVKNGRLLYVEHPTGEHNVPGVHTKYVEEDIDLDNVPLNGGVLIKVVALSSDPYLRYRMREPHIPQFVPAFALGQPIYNFGVGKVLRSEDPLFMPGDHVVAQLGFEQYSIYPSADEPSMQHICKIDKVSGIPAALHCGVLGLAGKTAYGGFKAFAMEKAKISKTMFISGAAGPVGTVLIEYAKHVAPHLKIIASAGSPDKIDILKSIGADVVINYKTDDLAQVLKEHGPIDIYWDHVSGSTLDAALMNMSDRGLIVACGAISAASGDGKGSPVMNFEQIFQRNLEVHGFIVATEPRVVEALATFYEDMVPLVLSGKITNREHRYTLEQGGESIADLHLGKNTGKALVVVSEDD